MTGIYKITNKITNQSYIGQSKNINKRFESHKNNSSNPNLRESIKLFGIKAFKLDVLEICEEKKLLEREKFYINIIKPEFNIQYLREQNRYDYTLNKFKISNKTLNKVKEIIRVSGFNISISAVINKLISFSVNKIVADKLFMKLYKEHKFEKGRETVNALRTTKKTHDFIQKNVDKYEHRSQADMQEKLLSFYFAIKEMELINDFQEFKVFDIEHSDCKTAELPMPNQASKLYEKIKIAHQASDIPMTIKEFTSHIFSIGLEVAMKGKK